MEKLRAFVVLSENVSLRFYSKKNLHFVEMVENGKVFYQYKSFKFNKAQEIFFALVGINWLYQNEIGGQYDKNNKSKI